MPRALVVDDEPGIRLALKRWFERQGYSVLEAADGPAALACLADHPESPPEQIAVVVCDLHLPGMSGVQLLQRLRTEQPAVAARVILTTGDQVDGAAPDSLLAQHPFVLQKPFDLATLKIVVERVVNAS